MQSTNSIALDDKEFDMAATILQMIKSSLDNVSITASYVMAKIHVSGVDHESSASAISVWCGLTRNSVDNLILIALGKELAQIVADIDADDSVVDFFGWLLVGKMHGVDIMEILNILDHRIHINKPAW